MSLSLDIEVEGLGREEARELLIKLPRNKQFLVHILKDGRKAFIRTDGRKISMADGKPAGNFDFTVHYEGEERGVNYIDDVLVDIKQKEVMMGEENVLLLLKAIKDAIELVPIKKIWRKYPKLEDFEKMELKGHSIELLLIILRWLGLQEDVNYWGMKPSRKERYEGREKPYHALEDYFIKKIPFKDVIRKHKL